MGPKPQVTEAADSTPATPTAQATAQATSTTQPSVGTSVPSATETDTSTQASFQSSSSESVASGAGPGEKTYNIKNFTITTRKLPILKADPIDYVTEQLGFPVPEMIFGDNFVSIEHPSSNWGIQFNCLDALQTVDKTGNAMLKVSYSQEWQKSREKTHHGIKEVVNPFDWSYTTDYRGSVSAPTAFKFSKYTGSLPLEQLKRPDPILFYDEVILYEDELADNGISTLSCKIRVMPNCLLVLMRFFMRLDNVLIRLRDTRVYVDLDNGHVIREYQAKEQTYDELKKVLRGYAKDIPAMMRDPNGIAPMLPVVESKSESMRLDVWQ